MTENAVTKTIRLTTDEGFHKDIRALEVTEETLASVLTEYAKGFKRGRELTKALEGKSPLEAFKEGRSFVTETTSYNLGFEDALSHPIGHLEVV